MRDTVITGDASAAAPNRHTTHHTSRKASASGRVRHDAGSGLSSESLRRYSPLPPRSSVESAARVGVGAPPSPGDLLAVEKDADWNFGRPGSQV